MDVAPRVVLKNDDKRGEQRLMEKETQSGQEKKEKKETEERQAFMARTGKNSGQNFIVFTKQRRHTREIKKTKTKITIMTMMMVVTMVKTVLVFTSRTFSCFTRTGREGARTLLRILAFVCVWTFPVPCFRVLFW